ncbi:MoxR family ATPase [Phragmitibacter flavus]|uniref:MoxR family ATPase n=1 Tax=Phragmitibacter flavus TaxID=2576071 RepID=A0A5R8KGZ5_9BACT|nr:MoxR family ATPase [Phragmitibacter flavus]TLD71527.1 MoxR family ATPase [Phragmitibacter flavus]
MTESLDTVKSALAEARAEIAKVIIGQQHVIDHALIAIFTGHHVLVEGVPGVGKTLLVRTLAKVLGGDFARIQFTPDLMPADITGTSVFNLKDNDFVLVKGPVFTSFLLADEINRAPAKTQSALLQAMQERLVTIDNETHELSSSFTVFATQNPVEYEGTYPLPEAQKDRFMFKVNVGYPDRNEELSLANRMLGIASPEAVLGSGEGREGVTADRILALRQALQGVTVREELVAYVVDMVRATREHEAVLVGAGPRATQSLILASRARAALDSRDFVTPDDVRTLAEPVLGHRLILRPEFEIEGLTIGELIGRVLEAVPVPR